MARPNTTATPAPEPLNSRNHPAVVAATAALNPIRIQHDADAARVQKYRVTLAPPQPLPDADGRMPSPAATDILSRLEAESNLATATLDARRSEAELLKAQQTVETAREHARVEIAQSFEPSLRNAVRTLRTALQAARTANIAIQTIQMACADASGLSFNPLSIPTLNSQIEFWEGAMAAAGYLTD